MKENMAKKEDSLFKKWWFWVIAFFAVSIFWSYQWSTGIIEEVKQEAEREKIEKQKDNAVPELSVISGVYLDKYNYEIISAEGDSRYAVSFDPFLPLNDAIMIGAMMETITQIYGKHKLADLEPKLVQRNGIGLIYFEGVDYDYYFSIVKEDTGDINSFTMWTE